MRFLSRLLAPKVRVDMKPKSIPTSLFPAWLPKEEELQ